jgi:mannose-1-phosphate guanylyltransferase
MRDTEDALLIAHRDRSQDVGKIVKELSITGRSELI